jgi:hypothetical protein
MTSHRSPEWYLDGEARAGTSYSDARCAESRTYAPWRAARGGQTFLVRPRDRARRGARGPCLADGRARTSARESAVASASCGFDGWSVDRRDRGARQRQDHVRLFPRDRRVHARRVVDELPLGSQVRRHSFNGEARTSCTDRPTRRASRSLWRWLLSSELTPCPALTHEAPDRVARAHTSAESPPRACALGPGRGSAVAAQTRFRRAPHRTT